MFPCERLSFPVPLLIVAYLPLWVISYLLRFPIVILGRLFFDAARAKASTRVLSPAAIKNFDLYRFLFFLYRFRLL